MLYYFLALIGCILVFYFCFLPLSRMRGKALAKAAKRLQLEFDERQNDPFLNELLPYDLPLFKPGDFKILDNVSHGYYQGWQVACFDYWYAIKNIDGRTTSNRSVVCVFLQGHQLPAFVLRPEGLWQKVEGWAGQQDIDFDTHPEFSRRFLLRGADEIVIRQVFTPAALEFFEKKSTLCLEAAGDRMILYRDDYLIKPWNLKKRLDEACAVLTAFALTPPTQA